MSGESLDDLLQKLVLDARQREAESRKAARPVSTEDELAAGMRWLKNLLTVCRAT